MVEEKSNLSINISSGNASKIKDEYEEVFNISDFSNSTNFYPNKKSKKIKLKKRYFMCCNCKITPQLDFKDNVLDLTCDCKEIFNLRIKDFINKYSYCNREDVVFYLSCKEHKQNIYKCYCLECSENLCEECLKITKLHDNHSINNFFSVKNYKEVNSLKELNIKLLKKKYNLIFLIKKIIIIKDKMNENINSDNNFENIQDDFPYRNNFNNSEENKSMNFYSNQENKKKKKSRYYICRECFSSPKITFIVSNLLKIKCDCKKYINIRTNDFIESYINHENKDNIQKYLNCKEHNNRYIYYCFDCKLNLCEECLIEYKIHENHSKENLLFIDDKIDKVKKLIKVIRKKLPKGDIEIRKILNIIEAIIKKYKDYPSHNLYESIFNSEEFLSKLDIPLIIMKFLVIII